MEKQKVPLLSFSGGLDSTFLLQGLLEKGDVETLYVTGAQCGIKVEKEKEVRKKIIKKLEELTGNKVRKDHHVVVKDLFTGDMPDHAFLQPALWINGALQVSNADVHEYLAIGYVAGDQVSCMLPEIEKTWVSIQSFTKHTPIPVEFPLKFMRKLDILERIYPETVQHVWVCEMPEVMRKGKKVLVTKTELFDKIKPCGYCAACLTSHGTLAMWKARYGVPYSTSWITRLNARAYHRQALEETPELPQPSYIDLYEPELVILDQA